MPIILDKELERLIDEFGLAIVLRSIAEIVEKYKMKATTAPEDTHDH